MKSTVNPYSPPVAATRNYYPRTGGGLLYRDGDVLLIFNGASFPSYCIVTGTPTQHSFPVAQTWHPHWVSLLAIAFIFPYFLVAPFFSRSILLELPLDSTIIERHLQLTRIGLRFLAAAALLFLVWLAFVFTSLISSFIPMLAICLMLAGIGFVLSSRQVVALRIVAMHENLLLLKGIHQDFLSHVPEWQASL